MTKKRFEYALVKLAFHNGGIVSKHYTLEAAEKAARKFRKDCNCGCCEVVAIDKLEQLKEYSPDMGPYIICL